MKDFYTTENMLGLVLVDTLYLLVLLLVVSQVRLVWNVFLRPLVKTQGREKQLKL